MKKFSLPLQFAQQWQEFRRNRRLQVGILVILGVLVSEGTMRWFEFQGHQETRLTELRSQRMMLQGQSRDETVLKEKLAELETARDVVEKRMWVVPSEAVGQARQKDWLLNLFKQSSVAPINITLGSPRPFNGKSEGGAAAAGSQEDPQGFMEFRASISFPFSPAALENILNALEGGEPFVQIEVLRASRRERKVDIEMNMLMEVNRTKAPLWAKARAEEARVAAQSVDMEAVVKDVMTTENVKPPAGNN